MFDISADRYVVAEETHVGARKKRTERVSKIRGNRGQADNFNNFCQFVSKQADLTTDPVYSEEGISRPKDIVDEYCKSG